MDNILDSRVLNDKLFNRLLKVKGVTQKKMAKDLKINEKTMSLYKSDYQKFTPSESKSIAQYLGITVDELWTIKKDDETTPADDLTTLKATLKVLTLNLIELKYKLNGGSITSITQEIESQIESEIKNMIKKE